MVSLYFVKTLKVIKFFLLLLLHVTEKQYFYMIF